MIVNLDRLKSMRARITNRLYFAQQVCKSRLSFSPAMKIIFSDDRPSWIPYIQTGFRFTRHKISFARLTRENIKGFDVVVPFTLRDLECLDRERDLVADWPIPVPGIRSVRLCNDKYRFNRALVENGFSSFVPRMGHALKLPYPYILKKNIDESGKNSYVISGVLQEKELADRIADPEYFSQEMIVGRYEYASHILFKNGAVVCAVNIEYYFARDKPIKGKDEPICKVVCRAAYLDVFSSILLSIGFEGLCCFNYKVQDGRPLIMEINPRFGRSLSLFFFSFIQYLDPHTRNQKAALEI